MRVLFFFFLFFFYIFLDNFSVQRTPLITHKMFYFRILQPHNCTSRVFKCILIRLNLNTIHNNTEYGSAFIEKNTPFSSLQLHFLLARADGCEVLLMGQLFFSHTKLIGRGSRAPHQKLLFNLSNQSVRKLIMLIRSDYREFLIYFTTKRKIIATKTRDNVECSLNRRLSCSCPQSINYFRESVHFITGIYDSMSLKDLIYCIFFVKHKSDEF